MNRTATGQRRATLSCSCANVYGGRMMAIRGPTGALQCLSGRKRWRAVVLGDETPVDVAGPNAELEHDGRITGLRQFALDPSGSEIGERVRCDVGADRRFPRDGTPEGVIDGSGQHGGGGRLTRRSLEVHPKLVEQVLRIREHVHEVRDGRALVSTDVGPPGLEQCLGYREDPLPAEHLARTEPQGPHFLGKRSFGHHTSNVTGSIEIGSAEHFTARPHRGSG